MKYALKLTIFHFNGMENSYSDAIYSDEYFFFDDEEGTAHKKCGDYIESLKVNLYLGWNEVVYPQFKVEKVYLK